MTPSMSEVRRWFSHHCSAMRPPLEWPITRILVFGHIAWICVTSVLSLATSSWMVVVATSSDVYACSVTTGWSGVPVTVTPRYEKGKTYPPVLASESTRLLVLPEPAVDGSVLYEPSLCLE